MVKLTRLLENQMGDSKMNWLGKISLSAVLAFALFPPAGTEAGSKLADLCKRPNETLKPGIEPSYQMKNCLLTNAALRADIPPEVVKGVATRESGGWKQYGVVSADGGIGIMQVTDSRIDQERLKNDIVFNIETGVKILSNKYNGVPHIKGANRDIIENWYFPVLGYNGNVPKNSPLTKSTGRTNTEAYQEKVFKHIMDDSYQQGMKLSRFPFTPADFTYDPASTNPIIFNVKEYNLKDPLHPTAYKFKKGQKLMVAGTAAVNIRKQPTTASPSVKSLKRNAGLIISGAFTYDLNSKTNQFVWYQVMTVDGKTKGYVSSAYLAKDSIPPSFTGVASKTIKRNALFNTRSGIKASDNVDGDLTKKILVSSNVNTKKKGSYTVKYTVKDSTGNVRTQERKITVK